MRARRKKHLDERTDIIRDIIVVQKTSDVLGFEESERYDVKTPFDLFKNDNPVELEIGCGKGRFIVEKAMANKNINYLGVEIQQNVLITGAERVKKEGLSNVKLFNCGAEILKYELPAKSIDKLYLNFSCPYPKKQYENHRLTYFSFLEIYKYLLKDGAEIHFKTDNDDFFEFSVNSFLENGFEITYKTFDLHAENPVDNVMTEYEQKFVALGKNINKLVAKVKL
ncbi:MAG: tRNA (guanosine(46)-N7)-methyltransferase TrmB [Clostridia bacterium]|nr:tRNA (guanosine(46)-N7)-methyltransferase TrmB [Clostridia bacterium]